jgi:hypothetical protein
LISYKQQQNTIAHLYFTNMFIMFSKSINRKVKLNDRYLISLDILLTLTTVLEMVTTKISAVNVYMYH